VGPYPAGWGAQGAATPTGPPPLLDAPHRPRRGGGRRAPPAPAPRFAAKEALAKALGAPGGLLWTDAEVYVEDSGQPRLRVSGTVRARAAELGVRSWHISLSHDAGIASAVVIAEG
ncbi:holo-ACP synthase, partial [Streptomyces sp. NPDC059411]|uniref:holo-ACP synthase n=1 Tax=Streptomyces sp. NPDC059411 TaxID=3346825 RepID=UPI0036B417CB